MAITETHVGRRYPPTAPYEVSAAKIAEFAAALGETATPEAPPTFVAVVSSPAWQMMFDDDELDLALNRMMHVEQKFAYKRPVRAGDVITAQLTIADVRVRPATDIIGISVDICTTDGELLCRARSSFYHSREAGA